VAAIFERAGKLNVNSAAIVSDESGVGLLPYLNSFLIHRCFDWRLKSFIPGYSLVGTDGNLVAQRPASLLINAPTTRTGSSMNLRRTMLFLLCFSPLALQAQSGEPPRTDEAPAGWSIGLGVATRAPIYAGESSRTLPLPLIGYEGERFYIQGASVGYRFIKNDSFTLKAYVAANTNGIDADKFGRNELAQRGIDRNLLEDRDFGADAGVTASWKTAIGVFETDVRADISNTSDGYQASFDYRAPLPVGNAIVVPGVGITAYSSDLADYYYGTLSDEVKRGVVNYKPGSATVPHASVTVIVPFASKWTFISNVNVDFLPNDITDSPLVDKDSDVVPTLFLGVSRKF
jgi:MipA family protein